MANQKQKKPNYQWFGNADEMWNEDISRVVKKKLKYLGVPFVVMVATVVFVSHLALLITGKFWGYQSMTANQNWFWLPAVISLIFSLLWIWPRAKLLILIVTSSHGTRVPIKFIFYAAPLISSLFAAAVWEDIRENTGAEIVRLKSIREIEDKSAALFYDIRYQYTWKNAAGIDYEKFSWKNRQNDIDSITFQARFAAPCYAEMRDTGGTCYAWVVYEFQQTTSYSDTVNWESAETDFYIHAAEKYHALNLYSAKYFRNVLDETELEMYQQAIAKSPGAVYNNEPVLVAGFTPIPEKEEGVFFSSLFTLFAILACWFGIISFVSFNETELKAFEARRLKKVRD